MDRRFLVFSRGRRRRSSRVCLAPVAPGRVVADTANLRSGHHWLQALQGGILYGKTKHGSRRSWGFRAPSLPNVTTSTPFNGIDVVIVSRHSLPRTAETMAGCLPIRTPRSPSSWTIWSVWA